MKKIAITKLENDQTEVGIQLRNGPASSDVENRIQIDLNAGVMDVYVAGNKTVLNVAILDQDPVSPVEKQIWINAKSGTLKYKLSGVINSIALPNQAVTSTETTFDYLGTLTQVELKQLAPTTIPNYLIDDFASTLGTLSNLSITASSLTATTAGVDGNYQREQRSTIGVNSAEGVVVTTAQALAPTGVALAGGVTTLSFKGDVTGLLRTGKKVLVFEEEILTNGNRKSYYLLDSNARPVLLEVASESYNSGTNTSTVTITNPNNYDLALGFSGSTIKDKVRIYPFGVNMKVGGNGLAGTLTDVVIEEAHGVESAYRVLGEEISNQIKTDIAGETVKAMTVQKSPNGLNWLIMSMVGKSYGGSVIKIWYSTDGLASINYVTSFTHQCEVAGQERNNGAMIYGIMDGYIDVMSIMKTHINNDGRFVFSLRYYSGSGYGQDRVYFGTMSGSSFKWAVPHQGLFAGGNGVANWEHNSHDAFTNCIAMDWDNGLVFVPWSRPTNSTFYIVMFELDFSNLLGYSRGVIGTHDSNANQSEANAPFYCKVINFEGENQCFLVSKHYNGHNYAWKIPSAYILAQTTGAFARGSQTQGPAMNVGFSGNVGYGPAMTADANVTGGNRFVDSAFGHQNASGGYTLDFYYDETNKVLHEVRRNDAILELHTLDFGRTRAGAKPKLSMTFSQVPDAGAFTISVTQVSTTTTNTTTSLTYASTAAQIKTALEALAVVGAGNATVTGDFTTGFIIELNKLEDYTFANPANTLTKTAVAVTINRVMLVTGLAPIWLNYTDMASQANIYTPAKGNFVQLLVDQQLIHERFAQSDRLRNRCQHFGQALHARGDTLYFSAVMYENGASSPLTKNFFFKIPNYKTLYGIVYSSPTGGAYARQRLGGDNNTYATAYAQLFTVPNVPYSGALYPDAKIPVRTVGIDLNRDWADSNPPRNISYTPYFRLRIVNSTGGLPDESSVIGTSITKIPLLEVDGYIAGTNDQVYFNFDNLKLTPASQVFMLLDVVGHDMISLVPSNYFTIGTYANGTIHKKINGVWSSTATLQMFFRIYDYYKITPHLETATQNKNIYLAHHNRCDGYANNQHTGASLYPIGDYATSKVFRNFFGVASSYSGDDVLYSAGYAGRKNYYIDIDDSTKTAEQFPVINDAKMPVNTALFDENLIFAYKPGADDETVKLDDYQQKLTGGTTVTDDKIYNITSHVGDARLVGESNMYSQRLQKYTGVYAGIVDDPDFLYGRAKRGQCALTAHFGRNFIQPFARDFIIELEYKALLGDALSTTATRILFNIETCLALSINNGKYVVTTALGNSNSVTNYFWKTTEDCPTNVYQRLRITRDATNGVRLFRNYSKTGGTWVQLTWDGTQLALANDLKNNTFIGYAYNNAYRIGVGCDYSTSTNAPEGCIGYFKYALNTTTFLYSGVPSFVPTRFNYINFGDKLFAQQSRNSFNHSAFDYNAYAYKGASDFVYVVPEKETSKVRTHDQVFKFKQAVAQGTKMAVRIDLQKDSANDPTAVQGYLVNFERK